MKLAIIGSRGFNDFELLSTIIKKEIGIENIDIIISGGAKGADSLGEKFAITNSIECIIYLPDWNLGMHAGFLRNNSRE